MDFSHIIPIILASVLIGYILLSLKHMPINNTWKKFDNTFIPKNQQEIINKHINPNTQNSLTLEESAVIDMKNLEQPQPTTSRAQPVLNDFINNASNM